VHRVCQRVAYLSRYIPCGQQDRVISRRQTVKAEEGSREPFAPVSIDSQDTIGIDGSAEVVRVCSKDDLKIRISLMVNGSIGIDVHTAIGAGDVGPHRWTTPVFHDYLAGDDRAQDLPRIDGAEVKQV